MALPSIKNRVGNAVTGTPGTGTITLGSAESGYQSFSTAYGANANVDILIEEGPSWEIARDCTYTHSGTTLTRGTLESSSTGAAVSFTSAAKVYVIETANRLSASAPQGNSIWFQGPNPLTYIDSDTIAIESGGAVVAGKYFTWAGQNINCGPSGTSPMNAQQIVYLYAYNNAGSLSFVWSTTAPTWSDAEDYFYGSSTSYRLLGWVYIWNAVTAGTYRIAPFTSEINGRQLRIQYHSEFATALDQFDSNDMRLGSTTGTTNYVSSASHTYSSIIPQKCNQVYIGLLIVSSVTGDSGIAATGAYDTDGGFTGFPSSFCQNSIRFDLSTNLYYMPKYWQPVDGAGLVYAAVNRVSGTGTVTLYVDVCGGALWL